MGVTGQGGHPDNESTPDTRQHLQLPITPHLLHTPSTTATFPQGRNQRCQPRESRKPLRPDIGPRRSQASSRNIQSGRCSILSLSDAASCYFFPRQSKNETWLHTKSSYSSHRWRIQLACTRMQTSSLKRFNYVSKL